MGQACNRQVQKGVIFFVLLLHIDYSKPVSDVNTFSKGTYATKLNITVIMDKLSASCEFKECKKT